MLPKIEVSITQNDLEFETYIFHLIEKSKPKIVLNEYFRQSRLSKRHKFRTVFYWSRLDKRKNNIEPVLSEGVKQLAREELMGLFESIPVVMSLEE